MKQCMNSENLHRRLKKIIGQVQAIDRMIDEDVPCEDVLAQLNAANMIAGEKVHIVDNNNGERFETYIIKGERGSGCICLNGAAARKVQVGDIVIIMSYAMMDFEEAKSFKPTVVFPDSAMNKIV